MHDNALNLKAMSLEQLVRLKAKLGKLTVVLYLTDTIGSEDCNSIDDEISLRRRQDELRKSDRTLQEWYDAYWMNVMYGDGTGTPNGILVASSTAKKKTRISPDAGRFFLSACKRAKQRREDIHG